MILFYLMVEVPIILEKACVILSMGVRKFPVQRDGCEVVRRKNSQILRGLGPTSSFSYPLSRDRNVAS